MREVLRERGEVANRDFEMGARTRVDHYRGRKDSSLALHYLWRVGEVMVSRRERFERVYALTESVAPADLLREHDEAEADDYLLMKTVAADGLTPMRTVSNALRRTVPPAELAEWRRRKIDAGQLVEVRVEGWRIPQVALAADVPTLEVLAAGGVPAAWQPLDTTTAAEATFLSPLEPVSARGPGQAAVRLRLRLGGLQAGAPAPVGLLHAPDPVGRPAGRPVRQQARPGERHARHQRPVAGGRGAGTRRRVRRGAPAGDVAVRRVPRRKPGRRGSGGAATVARRRLSASRARGAAVVSRGAPLVSGGGLRRPAGSVVARVSGRCAWRDPGEHHLARRRREGGEAARRRAAACRTPPRDQAGPPAAPARRGRSTMPLAFARSMAARPAGCIRPSAISRSMRALLVAAQTLRGLRGAK